MRTFDEVGGGAEPDEGKGAEIPLADPYLTQSKSKDHFGTRTAQCEEPRHGLFVDLLRLSTLFSNMHVGRPRLHTRGQWGIFTSERGTP